MSYSDEQCIESPAINFTDAAATKVAELMHEEDDLALKLRVYISGGGCSGFQYGFAFEKTLNDDDTVVEKTVKLKTGDNLLIHVTLLVDPLSLQYLAGAEIDYHEDVQGSQFIIRNPNAKTTCGCGSSFAVE